MEPEQLNQTTMIKYPSFYQVDNQDDTNYTIIKKTNLDGIERKLIDVDERYKMLICKLCNSIGKQDNIKFCKKCKTAFCSQGCLTRYNDLINNEENSNKTNTKTSSNKCKCEFTDAHNLIRNVLTDKKFTCNYAQFGCLEVPSYNDFFNHVEECQYFEVVCNFCQHSLPFINWTTHIKTCKLKRIICEFCNKMIYLKDESTHKNICDEKVDTCNYCFEKMKNKELSKHECHKKPIVCKKCYKNMFNDQIANHHELECTQIQLKNKDYYILNLINLTTNYAFKSYEYCQDCEVSKTNIENLNFPNKLVNDKIIREKKNFKKRIFDDEFISKEKLRIILDSNSTNLEEEAIENINNIETVNYDNDNEYDNNVNTIKTKTGTQNTPDTIGFEQTLEINEYSISGKSRFFKKCNMCKFYLCEDHYDLQISPNCNACKDKWCNNCSKTLRCRNDKIYCNIHKDKVYCYGICDGFCEACNRYVFLCCDYKCQNYNKCTNFCCKKCIYISIKGEKHQLVKFKKSLKCCYCFKNSCSECIMKCNYCYSDFCSCYVKTCEGCKNICCFDCVKGVKHFRGCFYCCKCLLKCKVCKTFICECNLQECYNCKEKICKGDKCSLKKWSLFAGTYFVCKDCENDLNL